MSTYFENSRTLTWESIKFVGLNVHVCLTFVLILLISKQK